MDSILPYYHDLKKCINELRKAVSHPDVIHDQMVEILQNTYNEFSDQEVTEPQVSAVAPASTSSISTGDDDMDKDHTPSLGISRKLHHSDGERFADAWRQRNGILVTGDINPKSTRSHARQLTLKHNSKPERKSAQLQMKER